MRDKSDASDVDDDDDDRLGQAAGPTYISVHGMEQLRAEHTDLLRRERPKIVRDVADAAAMGDRSENAEYIYGKRRLREIDRRLLFLEARLRQLVVVQPSEQRDHSRCAFGATIVAADASGHRRTWTLVGPDEIDSAAGLISYKSPVGAALLGKQVDDDVRVQTPAGVRNYTIVSIEFG